MDEKDDKGGVTPSQRCTSLTSGTLRLILGLHHLLGVVGAALLLCGVG